MRRSKKIFLSALLSVVVLGGTIGGVALASDGEDGNVVTRLGDFLEKVIGIYEEKTGTTIDEQALEESIQEARDQIRTEQRDEFRQKLIDEGIVTQEQLDEYDQWMESRPDFPTEEFQQWLESRPDLPNMFGFGDRGGMKFFGSGDEEGGRFFFGMQRGHRGPGGGFHGWCLPGDSTE